MPVKKNFVSYEEAKKIVHPLGLKGKSEWAEFTKTDEFKDLNLPSGPPVTYKNKGWISWGDFLGTGTIANQNREFPSYEEAKKIVHPLGLKSQSDWKEFIKTDEFKNLNFPVDPYQTYKNDNFS